MEDIDREGFFYPLKNCKNLEEIKELIDNIDNDDLQKVIQDKYIQFFEYNKSNNLDISALIVTLESTYFEFLKNK